MGGGGARGEGTYILEERGAYCPRGEGGLLEERGA